MGFPGGSPLPYRLAVEVVWAQFPFSLSKENYRRLFLPFFDNVLCSFSLICKALGGVLVTKQVRTSFSLRASAIEVTHVVRSRAM